MKNDRNKTKSILYNVFISCMVLLGLGTLLNFPSIINQAIMSFFIVAAFGVPVLERSIKLASLTSFVALLAFLVGLYTDGLQILRYLIIVVALSSTLLYIFVLPSYSHENSKQKENSSCTLPPNEPQLKQGDMISYLMHILSYILCCLNPFQLIQFFSHSIGSVLLLARLKGQLPSPHKWQQQGTYHLPFEGEWLVGNGGTTEANSHSWQVLNQRYAYDFVIADENGRRHKGTGEKLTDYYCYGKPILAPADGWVVSVQDGIRDAPRPGSLWIDCFSKDFRGNYVIIRHKDREYSFMAHFIPGSIKVKKGERVTKGEEIAKCGNSGHSTEPHLHFHIQDTPNFYTAVGLPVHFSEVIVDGKYSKKLALEKGMNCESYER